jgi:hypothetical protein
MSTPMTKIAGVASTELGRLIRSRREQTIDPATRRPYTRASLGQAVGMSMKGIEAIENGRTKTVAPHESSRFSSVLGLSVSEILTAMGYRLEGQLTPAERELVALHRRVPQVAQAAFVDGCRALARGMIEMAQRLAPYDLQERAPRTKVADRGRE